MSSFILIVFNSIIFAIYSYLLGYILLHKNQTDIKRIMIAFFSLFAMYYCILCLLDSVYATFFSVLYSFLFIKILFKENMFMSLFISLIIYTTKIIFKIMILIILNNKTFELIHTYKTLDLDALYINIIAMILSVILILVLRRNLRRFIKKVSSFKNREFLLLTVTYFDFIIIILFQPPENIFSIPVIADFLVIFTVTAIGIFSISSEKKMECLMNHYQEIFEYAKANEELLNNYKMQVHENKNKLLMIKGMVNGSKNEVIQYIDSILKEIDDDNNYWLTELKYIPLLGVRNFINYKLIKLKDLGAEIEVFVSSELEDIDTSSLNKKDYNQLSTILGVILDNMIEAIEESKEKLISINIYLENGKTHGEFANTFSSEVDINRLNEIGYTTKGKQHGVGLSLVSKITKMNDRFECTPKIIDKFFTQHLIVKLYQSINLQKNSKKKQFITKTKNKKSLW